MHLSSFLGTAKVTFTVLFYTILIPQVNAQIIPDNTLGNENSTVIFNQTIRGTPGDAPGGAATLRIDGGAVRGNNLFHSFQEFNVEVGRGAYFSNPEGIQNILTRVTGENPSNILGVLGVLGNANLFLINPNGIVFGPNARLDVAGSFFATTADGILFENGVEFAASNPQAPPLLTINMPVGLNLRNPQPNSTITNQGNLSVGQDLTLVGGNLNLQGQLQAGRNLTLEAQEKIEVSDTPENPFIAEANNQLLLQANQIQISTENHPNSGFISGENMRFRSPDAVQSSTQYWSGGNFQIEQFDGNLGRLSSPNGTKINSGGDVSFDGYNGSSLHILAGGNVNINQINITRAAQSESTPETVILSNGITPISINGSAQPTVDIRAGTTVTHPRNLTAKTPSTSANINIGRINLTQPNGLIFLSNQYQPNSSFTPGKITLGTINTGPTLLANVDNNTNNLRSGGSVIVDARGEISLTNTVNTSAPFFVNLSALPPGIDLTSNLENFTLELVPQLLPAFNSFGNGGDVTLLAQGNITLNPGSTIESLGLSGGNIILNSQSNVSINDGFVTSVSTGEGIGGDIKVSGQSISVRDFGVVLNLTIGSGQGGNVDLNAVDTVAIFNQGNSSSVSELNNDILNILFSNIPLTGLASSTIGIGNGGNLTITTNTLTIRNPSQNITGITTSTLPNSRGNGGNLTINATNLIEVIGNQTNRSVPFQLRTVFSPLTSADDIPSEQLITTGITTGTTAIGQGGNLEINTRQFIVEDGVSITSSNTTTSQGNAGSLTVNVSESLELRGFAGLLSGSSSSGDGGELTVNAPTGRVILEDGAGIATDASDSGNAGNLTLNAAEVILRSPNNLAASGILTSTSPNSTGSAGNLTLKTGELTVENQGQISASTSGEGAGGTVKITSEQLTVRDQAQITVSSDGEGEAGNLEIDSQFVLLDNEAALSAETSAGDSGNITLNSEEIQLRRNSRISTNATGEATGGGIIINTDRLIALENSDITANAEQAFGGQIAINANAVLGTRIRQQPTAASDITASSQLGTQFSGTIDFNSEFDSSGFAVEFSQEVVDPEAIIAENPCRENQESQFIITGRGGLPPNPTQETINPAVSVGLSDQIPETEPRSVNPIQRRESSRITAEEQPISSLNIVPARGWIRDENGDIILVGYDPTGTQVRRSNSQSQRCNMISD
ncbi:filamentous hemagglutinin N-terminal domain-containing protein [Capilliphycus salinus ALCB114379]|uniref:two-partner secretion domain-containing protein n=1 Tax=Capilliphycus salinus TaxID=2768948 RepID=UPI0039A427AE